MIFLKKTPVGAADLLNKVVYVWLGRMRWLPHIGPCYLVVGSRDQHVIAVPVNKQRLPIGDRVFIHLRDIACACDPYVEHPAVEELMSQYRAARNSTDDRFAKALRAMETDDVRTQKLASIRKRKRPVKFHAPRKEDVPHVPE